MEAAKGWRERQDGAGELSAQRTLLRGCSGTGLTQQVQVQRQRWDTTGKPFTPLLALRGSPVLLS